MAQGFSLKDQLFNAEKVRHLADLFGAASDDFDTGGFETQVMSRLPELELKARISWIADCLRAQLRGPLPEIEPVLRAALPPPLDPTLTDDDFGDFIYAPLGELVVAAGLQEHTDLSLDLLEDLTQRFSMEWAIRPFLNDSPDLVLERMQDWAGHPSYHVRRLVSEGTRPRLPWGQAVGLDLRDPLPLLDRIHADPARFVTRSVANHLNDITKKEPDLAMDRLQDWAREGRQAAPELRWMTAHALRGLVKSGHPRALLMLGYDPGAQVEVTLEIAPGNVVINDALRFSCRLNAAVRTPVLVDYVLHFQRPNGKSSSKVFKLKQGVVPAGQDLVMDKRHPLKGNATTFTLVPGAHRLEIQVNGRLRAAQSFDLRGV